MITTNTSLERICLLLAVTSLSMSVGFLSGRIASQHPVPTTLKEDRRPLVPTVHIEGVRNGLLHGSITGSARIVMGDQILTQSGIFALDASPLLRNEVSVVVPSDAQYVASTRGKKYYPVFSAAGDRISPKNRVYFSSEAEAELAGFGR